MSGLSGFLLMLLDILIDFLTDKCAKSIKYISHTYIEKNNIYMCIMNFSTIENNIL